MNSMPVPVIVVNLDETIRYVNGAFELLTGSHSVDVIGIRPPYPWQSESEAAAPAETAPLRKNEEKFRKKWR